MGLIQSVEGLNRPKKKKNHLPRERGNSTSRLPLDRSSNINCSLVVNPTNSPCSFGLSSSHNHKINKINLKINKP